MRIARWLLALVLSSLFLIATASAQSPRTLSDLPPGAQARIRQEISRFRQRVTDRVERSGSVPTMEPWSQVAESDLGLNEQGYFYGTSLAVSGNTIVVADISEVLVFQQPAKSNWSNLVPSAVLVPSGDVGDNLFGSSVAISGNTIVVGAPPPSGCNCATTGGAYVFVQPPGGWSGQLMPTAELLESKSIKSPDSFGTSVSISGDTAVVGAPGPEGGATYVFVKPANGWTSMAATATLTSSEVDFGDQFGTSVSIDGNTVVVGAPNAIVHNVAAGAACIFTEPQTGWKNMTETARLAASDGTSMAQFGAAIAIGTNTIVVGAPRASGLQPIAGAAYVFTKPSGGWKNATQTAKLVAPDEQRYDGFGSSVAIFHETVVSGAPLRSANLLPPPPAPGGAVYVFTVERSDWKNPVVHLLTGSDARDSDLLGSSVAVQGNLVIAGAPYMQQAIGGAFFFAHP